jgi:hypothetical protein
MRTAKLGQAGPSVGALGLGCMGVYATASLTLIAGARYDPDADSIPR